MAGAEQLTRSEADVWRYVAGFVEALGFAPKISEIGREIGVSKSSAFVRLRRLEALGLIRRLPMRHQAIEVLVAPPIPRTNDGAPLHFIPVDRLRLGHHGSNHNGGIGQDHA